MGEFVPGHKVVVYAVALAGPGRAGRRRDGEDVAAVQPEQRLITVPLPTPDGPAMMMIRPLFKALQLLFRILLRLVPVADPVADGLRLDGGQDDMLAVGDNDGAGAPGRKSRR